MFTLYENPKLGNYRSKENVFQEELIIGKNGLDKYPLGRRPVEFCRGWFEGTRWAQEHKEVGGVQTDKKDHGA